ncbi:MAG: hypothetical protein KDJ52_20955 [Anaerolineae bacterium]|nr:hypothetical protein [Anaerolineae bacterium]
MKNTALWLLIYKKLVDFPRVWLILMPIMLVTLLSCSTETPTPTEAAPATEEATLESVQFVPTPIPEESSPLPTPTPTLGPMPTITIPSPEGDTGVVHGRLLHLDDQPFADTTVRLGTIVWSPGKEGEDGYVASDRTASPQAQTDDWGNFVFENIPPGSYGLAVDNPEFTELTAFVLNDIGDKILVVEVEAGTVVDLEEVRLEFD